MTPIPEVPELAPADIQERLNQLFPDPPVPGKKQRRSNLVALFGQGPEVKVATTHAGEFHVRPVRSELELRALVPDDTEEDPRIAFLVPWRGSLPLDIGAFFVAGGRILSLGRELQLKRRFGATEIEGATIESALTKFLLADTTGASIPFAGGRLTADGMWMAWLAARFGLGDGVALSLEELLSWAARDDRGPSFTSQMPSELRAELMTWLGRRVGPAGSLAMSAWAAGQGPSALAWALVLEGMQSPSDATKMWRKIKLRALYPGAPDATLDEAAAGLADAAAGAFRYLEVKEPARVKSVLGLADKLVDVDEVRAALGASRYLPSVFTLKLDELGAAMKAAADEPTPTHLARCLAIRRSIGRHHLYKDPDSAARLERADMANRLLAWLVQRPDKTVAGGASVYADVERLARWYAAEGGFVDWARRAARGSDAKPFDRGINAIVQAVDRVRKEHDHAFAKALPHWLGSERPSNVVLPIERAVEHYVRDLLVEKAERKVLVILMDGMAWAQAVQLLRSLPSWGPLAWSTRSKRKADAQGIRPVLAHLPTVTEISRAAFFSSKRMLPGKAEPTDKDVERWEKNTEIAKLTGANEKPRLFLRGEGHTASGAAATEALNAVRDPAQRVVALVVNAIDASLKSDSQQRTTWTVDQIQPLRDLLDAAAEAKRVVLLASDHGHVPADNFAHVSGAVSAKARYREWKDPNEPLADFEVGITSEQAWAPKGAHGLVLIADEEHRYLSGPHAGEHGGATLAEVVAPFMLIGPDEETEDPELRVVAFKDPAWWYPDSNVTVDESPKAPPVEPKGRRKDSKPIKAQLSLPAVVPPVAAVHPLRAALEASELFKSRALDEKTRTQVLTAVDLLAGREGGQAPLPLFAQAMGSMLARAAGLVGRLSPNLNVDGFTVLSYDPAADMVELDIEKLRAIYGL